MDNVPVRTSSQAVPAKKSSKLKPSKKLALMIVSFIVLIGLIALIVLFFFRSSTAATIDSSKFQAVFFTNGQVYFGKLRALNGDYMKLTDIYYLQAQETQTNSENPQQTSEQTSPDVQLIKLGNEVHGPVDEMIISKDQMLFFENLKADGKVAQSIAKYKADTKQ